jgi:hypothetical protein
MANHTLCDDPFYGQCLRCSCEYCELPNRNELSNTDSIDQYDDQVPSFDRRQITGRRRTCFLDCQWELPRGLGCGPYLREFDCTQLEWYRLIRPGLSRRSIGKEMVPCVRCSARRCRVMHFGLST